jgi:lysophospholipase L1-like esterase
MKLKHTLVIFILGALLGIGISPWVNSRPQERFRSPISLAQAEESAMVEPASSGKILGAATQTQEEARKQAMDQLISQQDEELGLVDRKAPAEVEAKQTQETIVPNLTKKTITLAVYGDSMVDTMETGLPYLEAALRPYYPQAQFKLLNYGIGAETIDKGLARFNQGYSYKDRNYPSITQAGAEVIIIESFGYNPQGEAGLDTQWSALSQMVSQAQASGAKVLLLATIAPTKVQFGQGPGGIDWPTDLAWEHATLINRYLDNLVKLGQSLGVPVIDAYHASLSAEGEGILAYISSHDHIHPSVAGHQFVAGLIAKKMVDLQLIP